MVELYKYPVYHLTKLTDIKPGRCRVLVRDRLKESRYHTGGTCRLHHFGAGVGAPPQGLWSIDIEGCGTVYRRTRTEAIRYIAAWWDECLARETGRPLSTYAQRRAELAEGGERMSTFNIGDRPFPAIIHVKRGNELRRYAPQRTCRDTDYDTESITCSECGEITRDALFWVDVDGGKTVKGHRPRFCANCGAKVVDNGA